MVSAPPSRRHFSSRESADAVGTAVGHRRCQLLPQGAQPPSRSQGQKVVIADGLAVIALDQRTS